MQYILDLPSIKVRHKLAQAKMLLDVMGNESHPLHQAVKEEKGKRMKRGKSWMAEAENTLREICQLENINSGQEWKEVPPDRRKLTTVIVTMGREQRETADVITDNAIRELIDEHTKPTDPIIFTDGSVKRDKQSAWGFVVFVDNNVALATLRRWCSCQRDWNVLVAEVWCADAQQ